MIQSRRLHSFALLLVLALVPSCGGDKNPNGPSGGTPAPTPTPGPGRISITNLTASGEGGGGDKKYTVGMRLTETGGRAVTVNSITIELDNNRRATLPGDNTRIPASGALQAGPITVTDASPFPLSNTIAVTVAYTDEGNQAGSANAQGSVTIIVMVTLAGTVRDAATGAPIPNASLRVTTGPSQGVSTTADASGRYSLLPIQAGSFNIFVSASGYDGRSFPIQIDRDTPFDPTLTRTPPSVEYTITGTARTCSATYENRSGGTNQEEVRIPWSYSWSGAKSGDFLYVSCQINTASDRGSITVTIRRNGLTLQSASAVGFPNIATASGAY